MNAAVGTLVAFATAPGTVADDGRGRNSPFTTALLRRIETPGLEIRQLMAEVRREVRETTQGRQVPWENSALEGSFYFRAPTTPAPAPAVTASSAAAAPSAASGATTRAAAPDSETVFWESVRNSRSPAELRAYLARFPKGVFASLARSRLEELESHRPAPVSRPESNNEVLNPATPEGREALLLRVLAQEQPAPRGRLDVQVRNLRFYQETSQHRALAIAPKEQKSLRVSSCPWAAAAEELTLERCQLRNGEPCILFAVDDTIRTPSPGSEWSRREMERLRYEGPYRPDRIPAITAERRREPDIAGYGRAREPKAMAIHPTGRIFIKTAAGSPFAAETEALHLCNADPARDGATGTCFLYAAGNTVVMARRRTGPLAPDPARPAASVGGR